MHKNLKDVKHAGVSTPKNSAAGSSEMDWEREVQLGITSLALLQSDIETGDLTIIFDGLNPNLIVEVVFLPKTISKSS